MICVSGFMQLTNQQRTTNVSIKNDGLRNGLYSVIHLSDVSNSIRLRFMGAVTATPDFGTDRLKAFVTIRKELFVFNNLKGMCPCVLWKSLLDKQLKDLFHV